MFPQEGSEHVNLAQTAIDMEPAQGDEIVSVPASTIMRRKVDEFDWASTPLGARSDWSSELRIAVQQALDSHFPKAIVWGKGLTTIYNDAFLPILGEKPEALGRSFAEVWSESWGELSPIVERAFNGEATYVENFPIITDRSGHPREAWFTFCYSPLRLADGTIGGMLDTVMETTQTVQAQATLKLANQELAHRLKNTLALVQAIASQTLRSVADQTAIVAFEDRLQALAGAHDVLHRQTWGAVSLKQVISDALRPHGDWRQIQIVGPDLAIGSGTTMSFALYMHELATNAIKYGALRSEGGQIAVKWAVEDGRFNLTWRESGNGPAAQPVRTGFGSKLLDRGLGSQSEVRRHYGADGFELELSAPVEELAN